MPHPLIYEAPEVAALLGVAVSTLARKWRRLNRTHNFPRPLVGRSDAWSRALVDEWVNAGGAAPATEKRQAASIERQRRSLEERYAAA